MRVSVNAPAPDVLRSLLEILVQSPRFKRTPIFLRKDDGENKWFTVFSSNRPVQGMPPLQPMDSIALWPEWLLVPCLLSDDLVEAIASKTPLYPSSIQKAMMGDRELGEKGVLGTHNGFPLTLRSVDPNSVTVIEFKDEEFEMTCRDADRELRRGAGIDSISAAIGKKLEYTFEPHTSIKELLQSLSDSGFHLSCPDCGEPFNGIVPCPSSKCAEARRERREKLKDWLFRNVKEGLVSSQQKFYELSPEPDLWFNIEVWKANEKNLSMLYWETHPELKKKLEDEARSYEEQANELESEISELNAELTSMPTFSLFKGTKLKANREHLAKQIESKGEQRDVLLNKIEELRKRLESFPEE